MVEGLPYVLELLLELLERVQRKTIMAIRLAHRPAEMKRLRQCTWERESSMRGSRGIAKPGE